VGTFRQPKSTLATALWLVLAAIFVIRNRLGDAWRDPWWLAWGGVLAGGLLSSATSHQPLASLASVLPVLLAALGFGALRQLDDTQRRKLLGLTVASAVIQGLLTLVYLQPRWQPEAFARISSLSGRHAWIGTMGNTADVAILIALPAVLAAALALSSPRRRPVMALAACFLAAVVLGTRTLSVVGALGLASLVLLWRLASGRRRLVAIGALVVAGLLFATTGPIATRLSNARKEVQRQGWAAIGSGRGAGFAAGLSMVASRPIFGVGFGQFEASSFRHIDPDVLAMRARRLGLQTAFGQAHSEPLQHAAETGLIGIILAVFGIILAFRRSRSIPAALPSASALLAATVLISIAQFPLHQAAVAAQWVVIAALFLPPLAAPPAPSRRQATGQLTVVILVTVLAGFGAWQMASVALTNLEARLPWVPNRWRAQVVLGGLALEAGEPHRAVAHLAAALEQAERPEIRLNLGFALLAAGDRDAAFTHLIQAAKFNPTVYWQIDDPALAGELRERLEADGFGLRHPWMFDSARRRQ
jgi:hypothetical protein